MSKGVFDGFTVNLFLDEDGDYLAGVVGWVERDSVNNC